VIVLTGNGRAFSSGQDLADVQSRGEGFSIGDHLRKGYHRLI
jgi:enoyl-CoA hydratase/carnithine racemase